MTQTIMDKVLYLRKGRPIVPDRSNQNRYRIVSCDEYGLRRAYYFGVPIYRETDGKLLNSKFQKNDGYSVLNGSNAKIVLGDRITMKNKMGECYLSMPPGYVHRNDQVIGYRNVEVYPTTNGIACKIKLHTQSKFVFQLKTAQPLLNIYHNEKYLALMKKDFEPFVVVSCIGAQDILDNVVAPAWIRYRKIDKTELEVSIGSDCDIARFVLFEINLQEPKLFQDTTVESKNPQSNNVFGGTAFIGHTDIYGEQWLYSRPTNVLWHDLYDRAIQNITLYHWVWNANSSPVVAVALSTRFCSFGSTWNNKKAGTQYTCVSKPFGKYQTLNLTQLMVKNQRGIVPFEGWILKSAIKNGEFCVTSTGDDFCAPPILEVTYQ